MKSKLGIMFLLALMMAMFCVPVSAASTSESIVAAGFYDIGTATNVTITPKASSGQVRTLETNLDDDDELETFYANSDMLPVTYTGASSEAYYGVVLVEGDELPNKDNEIFYIDQVTANGNTVTFNVYPLLPTKSTDLTMYISSSEEDFDLISIPLNYATGVEIEAPTYTLGQVNDDSVVDAADALVTLEIAAKLRSATEQQWNAANVNKDKVVDAADALKILEYAAKLIDSWD